MTYKREIRRVALLTLPHLKMLKKKLIDLSIRGFSDSGKVKNLGETVIKKI